MAGGPEEGSGSPAGFGASPRWPTGVEMMNSPHLRPSRLHQGLHASEIPAGQARALQRRQALEAQQRAFREVDVGRYDQFRGRPDAGEAPVAGSRTARTSDSLAIVRRSGSPPRADESGGDIDVEVGDLAAQSLGRAIAAMAALSVQSAGGGMNSSTPSSAAIAPIRSRNRRFAATPPPDAQLLQARVAAAPVASWRRGRQRPPPGSWRPGRRCGSRRAGSRRIGHSGRRSA